MGRKSISIRAASRDGDVGRVGRLVAAVFVGVLCLGRWDARAQGCCDGVDVQIWGSIGVGDYLDPSIDISGAEACGIAQCPGAFPSGSGGSDPEPTGVGGSVASTCCKLKVQPCVTGPRTVTLTADPDDDDYPLVQWIIRVPECFAIIVNNKVPPPKVGEPNSSHWEIYSTNVWAAYYMGSQLGDERSIEIVPRAFIEKGRSWKKECDKLKAASGGSGGGGGGGGGPGPGGSGGGTQGTSSPSFDTGGSGAASGFRGSIPLGDLPDGSGAGVINWVVDDLSDPTSYTPAILSVAAWTNVTIYPGGDDPLRQVYHPDTGLANVTTNGPTTFQVDFYAPGQVTSPGQGGDPYGHTGSPVVSWVFQKGTGDMLTVTRTEGAAVDQSELEAASGAWVLRSLGDGAGSFARQEYRGSFTDIGASWTNIVETNLVLDLRTVPASTNSHVVRTLHDYPWGRVTLEESRILSDGTAQTTRYGYYSLISEGGTDNFTRLRSVEYPDGRWTWTSNWVERVEVEGGGGSMSNTAFFTEVRGPWLDVSLAEADASNCRRTISSYDGSARLVSREVLVGDDRIEYTEYPAPTLSGNIETQQECRYASETECLTTTTQKYIDGALGGRLVSVTRPDGRVEAYAYETNSTGAVVAEIVTRGNGAQNLGTRERTEYDGDGRVLARRTFVCLGSGSYDTDDPIEEEIHFYDAEGTETNVTRNGRSVFASESWVDGRLMSVTDETGITTEYGYDDFGRRYRETRGGITTTNGYDLDGRVISTVRYAGDLALVSRRGYRADGEVAWEIDERGLQTDHARAISSGGGLVETNVMASGATRVTEYFRDGRVKSVTGSGVVAEHHSYGLTNGNFLTERVDIGPGTLRHRTTVRDRAGRIDREIRPGPGGELVTVYGYAQGTDRLVSRQDPGLATRLFGYDAAGAPLREAVDLNANGAIDINADRITETAQSYAKLGGEWYRVASQRGYLAAGNPYPTTLSETREQLTGLGPATLSRTVSADASGAETVTTVTLDAATGEVTTRVDSPRSDLDAVTVSHDGRILSQTTHSSPDATTFQYDALGRLWRVTRPGIGTTTHSYDPGTGDLLSVADPTDRTTSYTYHANRTAGAGQVEAAENPDGTGRRYDYDLMGRVTNETGNAAYRVSYAYDGYGQMVEMGTYRDAGGSPDVTTWGYDEATGLLEAKTYADQRATTYLYDDAGQVTNRAWARGVQTSYAYNGAGDLTSVGYSDGTPGVTYVPDRAGRRTTIIDAAGTHTVTYLGDGTPESDTVAGGPLDGISVAGSFTDGWRDWVSASRGQTELAHTAYARDGRGRLGSVVADRADTVYVGYGPDGDRLQRLNFHAGGGTFAMARSYTHDGAGRVTGVQNGTLSGHAYGLDEGGRRISASRQDGTRWAYGYNSRGEVVAGTNFLSGGGVMPGGIFGYSFDDIGNRTGVVRGGEPPGGGTVAEAYAPANELNQITNRTNSGASWVTGAARGDATVSVNGAAAGRVGTLFWARVETNNESGPVMHRVQTEAQLAGAGQGGAPLVVTDEGWLRVPTGSETIAYDLDGNLTGDSLWHYGWDAENRLAAMWSQDAIPEAHRLKLVFDYDSRWRRIRKRVYRWGSVDYASSPETDILFVYDGWNLIAEVDNASGNPIRTHHWGLDLSGTMAGAGGVGGLLVTRHHGGPDGPKTYYPLYDGNGNVTGLADPATGAAVARYERGPFGEPMRATGPVAAANPVGFSSKYTDEETGLVYYGARYYNRVVGSWLNRDPIGQAGGANVYGAAENDFVNKGDALGLWTQVYRSGREWADVCSDSDSDDWPSLATDVTLDQEQANKWVKNYDGNPILGKNYQIANTIYRDIGPTRYGILDESPLSGYQAMVWRAISKALVVSYRGFKMKYRWSVSSGQVKSAFMDPAVWGYIFGGHGAKGAIYAPPDSVGPGISSHHKLGLLSLFACETGSTDFLGARPEDGGSFWLDHVAPRGEFLYYPGNAFFSSEPKKWP